MPTQNAMPRRRLLSAAPALLLASARLQAQTLPPLQVVTSHLPPFAVEGQGERRGALVDLVEAVMARAGWPQRVAFYPWARAMLMASSTPRTLILPLTRTLEREPNYQWLLRLYVQHFAFQTLKHQTPIRTLEQAKGHRHVVLRGSPNKAQLLRHGFGEAAILEAATVEDMHRMLEMGIADSLFGGTVVNARQALDSGRPAGWLRAGLVLESGDMWLAASAGVTPTELQRLQGAQMGLQTEGSVDRLLKDYEL